MVMLDSKSGSLKNPESKPSETEILKKPESKPSEKGLLEGIDAYDLANDPVVNEKDIADSGSNNVDDIKVDSNEVSVATTVVSDVPPSNVSPKSSSHDSNNSDPEETRNKTAIASPGRVVSSDSHSKSSDDESEMNKKTEEKTLPKDDERNDKVELQVEDEKEEEKEEPVDAPVRSSRPSRQAKKNATTKIRKGTETDDDDEDNGDDEDDGLDYNDEDDDPSLGSDAEDQDFLENRHGDRGRTKKLSRRNSMSKPASFNGNPRPSRRAKENAAKKLLEYQNGSDEEGAMENPYADHRDPVESIDADDFERGDDEAAREHSSNKGLDASSKDEDAKENVDADEEVHPKKRKDKRGTKRDLEATYDEVPESSVPKKLKATPIKAESSEKSSKRGKKRKHATPDKNAVVKVKEEASKDGADGNMKKEKELIAAVKKELEHVAVKKESNATKMEEDEGPPKKKQRTSKPRISEKNLENAAKNMLEVLISNYKDGIKEMPLDILAGLTMGVKGKPFTNHRSDAIQEGLKLLKSRNQAEKVKGAGKVGIAKLMQSEIAKIPKEVISSDPKKVLEQRYKQFIDRLAKHKKGGTNENLVTSAKRVWDKLLDGNSYTSNELVAETHYKGTNASGFEAIMMVLKALNFVGNRTPYFFTDKVFPHGKPKA